MLERIWLLLAAVHNVFGLSLEDIKTEFLKFQFTYNKHYQTQLEEQQRFDIFHQNLVTAEQLTKEEGPDGANFGVTRFMDLTVDEFSAFKGYKPSGMRATPTLSRHVPSMYVESPCNATSCDWRDAGAITPVKLQGKCGSCWAFSSAEGLESAWFLAGHELPVLSPQQIVSCDHKDDGCSHGDPPTAFKYIEKAGGLESNASYPYASFSGNSSGVCEFNKSLIVASMKGWSYAIPPCYNACNTTQNETALQQAIAQNGPASICVNANTWQFYVKGIVKGKCPSPYPLLDHCVQLVGYQPVSAYHNTSSSSSSYWIIKNSWSPDWGEQGYMYLEVGKNLCGVADEAMFVQA